MHELAATADVFLTSLLPTAREKLRIDDETIRAVNPRIIYASRHRAGRTADPKHEKGGYDSISFWSRGSVSASVTPEGAEPLGMPSGAFGDALSGMALAGGIAAALAQKAKTGEGRARRRLVARHRDVGDADGDDRAPRSPVSTRCRR